MDKRKENYYNYVVNDLVSKTEIDHEYMGGKIFIPFILLPSSSSSLAFSFSAFLKSFSSYFPHFGNHCRKVYGLTYEETKYVWNEYRQILKDKIENNG